MKFCPSCGNVLKLGAKFCTVCGTRFTGSAPVEGASTPSAATRKTGFLPRPGFRKRKFGEVLEAILAKLRIPLLLFVALIAVATLFLVVAAVLNYFLEYPVQFQVARDGTYLSTTKSLMKYDSAGNLVWRLEKGSTGKLGGQLEFDFGKDGKIYLANPSGSTVEVFSGDGSWRFAFGSNDLGEHFTPAVLDSGNIVVVDTGRHDVKFYTPGGVLISRMGGNGRSPGMFNFPNGVAQLPDGRVLVSETNNLRIQMFDGETLEFEESIWSLGGMASTSDMESTPESETAPANSMRFNWPARMAVDPAREQFYVVYADDFSTPDGYVGIFDFSGTYVGKTYLSTGIGKHIDARTLRPGPGKKFTFVDIEECKAGFWDPDSQNVMMVLGDQMADYLGRLGLIAGAHEVTGRIGKTLFLAALLLFISFMLFVYIVYNDLEIYRRRSPGGGADNIQPSLGGRIAVVLCSLFFPGLGQLFLKRYVLGAVLICLSAVSLFPMYLHYLRITSNSFMPVPTGIAAPVFLPAYVIMTAVYLIFYAGSLAHAVVRTIKD